jgi:hypothetical protein
MTTIDLQQAAYDERGIVTVKWARARFDNSLGFVVAIKPGGPGTGRNFDVRDPKTVSVLIPMEFERSVSTYYAIVYAMDSSGGVDASTGSRRLPVGNWPPESP